MATDNGGRISVSEEKLELALAKFKNELVIEFEKFATKAALEMLDARVKVLELWQAGIVAGHRQQRRASDRLVAWAAIGVALFGALAYWIFHG